LKEDFGILIKAFPEIGKEYTLIDYIRAKMVYASRSFSLKKTEGLVPIADMLNTDESSK
jgi:hypothetical protein